MSYSSHIPCFLHPLPRLSDISSISLLKALSDVIILSPFPQSIPNPILRLNHPLRQRMANPKEHKESPLPPEWINCNTESEPPYQLQVSEEIEGPGWCKLFNEASHVNPALHPEGSWAGERVRKEHEKDAGVNSDVPVSDRADSVYILIDVSVREAKSAFEWTYGAVVGANRDVLRWKGLKIPVGRRVRFFKAILGQKVERGPIESSCHNDNIALDKPLSAGPTSWNSLGSHVKLYSLLSKTFDVTPQPVRTTVSDLVHNIRIDHRRAREQSLVRGSKILQISVKELPQECLWDPTKRCLGPEDIKAQQDINNRIARYDPLVAPRKNVRLVSLLMSSKLQRLNSGRTTTDDNHLLSLGLFTRKVAAVVYLPLKLVHAGDMGNFRIAARPDRRDDTVKTTIGRVVDNPAPFIILIHFFDPSVKFSLRFEAIALPELGDLGDDLFTVGVAAAPLHAGVEAVHYGVDL